MCICLKRTADEKPTTQKACRGYPLTISAAMKSVKLSSTNLLGRLRGEAGELWQGRFFDRALRTVKEYAETVEYIYMNPLRRGLVRQPGEWRWSS